MSVVVNYKHLTETWLNVATLLTRGIQAKLIAIKYLIQDTAVCFHFRDNLKLLRAPDISFRTRAAPSSSSV